MGHLVQTSTGGAATASYVVLGSAALLLVLGTVGVQATPPLQLGSLSGPGEDLDSLKNELLNTVRLPRTVIPSHYDLEIRPILTPGDPLIFTAPGKVVIRVRCIVSTQNITLHAFDMDIEHAGVTVTSVQPPIANIPVTGHSDSAELQTYTIELGAALVVGSEYDVEISFVAKVGDRMSGLYRSWYTGTDGNPVYHATTQFQKLGARMAFPCFDEPNYRATFSINIGRSLAHNSLCNSPLETTIPIPEMDGWVWDVYGPTVNMPSYLIAIIVSDFVSVVAPEELSNYEVKTWGPPTMTDPASGEFSARAAAQIVTFFEDYYDSPYQFPKLDSVAIPVFEAGAMENWALNTYRTNLMLWYEGESTQFEQWRQAAVIAHEISHHWFGDLVTCDWWNDLWLNEGFARYMQFLGANVALPQHDILNRYTIDVIQLAMDFDAGPTTEPVRSNVTDQVNNQPSRVIYEKAGALIRMMQGFLTEATLIKGLQTYLDTYEYSNTVQDQLFEQLQTQAVADGTAAEFSVKEIMDTWTLKSGFPIVTIRRAGNNVVFISQEPFVPLNQKLTMQNPSELWYVPISYASKARPDFSSPANMQPKFWVDKYTLATTKIIEDSTTEWIVVNPDARSFFRVVYDAHFLSLILDQLTEDHTVISVSSRSQIIDDYFKSAFAGYVRLEDALEFTKYLNNEIENTVWTTVFNNLRQTNRYLQDRPPAVYNKWKAYLLSKITLALDTIEWEQQPTDTPVRIILRTQLLDWACALGAQKCEEVATTYATELATGTSIPADIQPMIYCKAVSMADTLTLPGDFDVKSHVLENYRAATRAERHTVFINSLACNAPKEDEIRGLLDSAIASPSDFTTAHSIQLMQRLADNPENRGTIVTYFQANMIPIIAALNQTAISSVITTMASYTSESSMVSQLDGLITAALNFVDQTGVINSLNAARATLATNIAWIDNYATQIETWIDTVSP